MLKHLVRLLIDSKLYIYIYITTDQYHIPDLVKLFGAFCTLYFSLLCILCIRSFNGTFVQCRAGSRQRRGTGPVVFSIDNAVVESEEDFAYTDDPQVFSVTPNDVIRRYYKINI